MFWSARIITAAIIALASPAFATTGYFSNGVSPQSKGMAGAGVAVRTGVPGLAANPAMGARYPDRAGACLSLFSPMRSTTISGAGPLTPGVHKSGKELFPIPCAGANVRIGDSSTLGLLVYANGGLNTDYDVNFFSGLGGGSAPLGVDLAQMFIQPTVATEIADGVSLGLAPIFSVQRFSAKGLEAFAGFSQAPGAVTNNGDDWSFGYGGMIGLLVEASPELTFGARYRSRIRMGRFDKYAGLIAENGDFDIPASAAAGVAYQPSASPDLTLTAEWEHIFYSDVAAIANPGPVPPSTGFPLGAGSGAGFGWKDMDILRIGAEWRATGDWTLRAGVSYNTGYTDGSQVLLNTLAPATPQWHLALGASARVGARTEVHLSYVHALQNTLSGAAPAAFGAQPVALKMRQHELTVGVSYAW